MGPSVEPCPPLRDPGATWRWGDLTCVTHHRAESGCLCSSFSSPSSPSALLTQTGGWRRRRARGSGPDPLGLCLAGWWNSVCEKAPYLCVSERCCFFLGTLRVLSPGIPIWLWKVQAARGAPPDSEGRTGSAAACCADVKPARGQNQSFFVRGRWQP